MRSSTYIPKGIPCLLPGIFPWIPIHRWYGSKTGDPKVRLPASRGNARFCRHWGEKQTGIYPITSPGGWNIIGRTPLILFDWNKISNPILPMGARIQFYAISHKEFSQHQGTLF